LLLISLRQYIIKMEDTEIILYGIALLLIIILILVAVYFWTKKDKNDAIRIEFPKVAEEKIVGCGKDKFKIKDGVFRQFTPSGYVAHGSPGPVHHDCNLLKGLRFGGEIN
jgi:hypothetical protein